MKLSKPKIYDKDNNEIIPPEGATGWVKGMTGFEWTFDNPGHTSKFIYIPEPFTGPLVENVEETFKFSEVPKIFDDTWYYRMKRKKTRMRLRRKKK